MAFSPKLLKHPDAASQAALDRIALAKNRIQRVLDHHTVAHRRTLEQKISDQGPSHMRVDPHLVGLAILDLIETKRLRTHFHSATTTQPWYSNLSTTTAKAQPLLQTLAPLYASIAGNAFGNLTGDALEVVIFKCLSEVRKRNPRYTYQGYFKLDQPKNTENRYRKIQPPKTIDTHSTDKEADFLQFGHDSGVICIECKNYREWIYPNARAIKELIVKAYELNATPLLIARRLHYTTITNFLEPAGIIAHQTYHQYFPSDQQDLANRARDKNSLGFTDIRATEEPTSRTMEFFFQHLPNVVDRMASCWNKNRHSLLDFAQGRKNLTQLYTDIDSPAGGKWIDQQEPDEADFQ